MLPGIVPSVAPVVYRPELMLQLQQLGALTGLQCALDAGDASSYNPGVQTAKWLDISGAVQDFYRGGSSAGDSAEPTFNGAAGARSKNEFWTFDGGDRFQSVVSVPAWANAFHKDNAVWSFGCWYWPVTAISVQSLFSTDNSSSSTAIGVDFIQDVTSSGNAIRLHVPNGAGKSTFSSTLVPVMGAWNFVGIAVDEANGLYRFQVNQDQELRSLGGYTSPSSLSADTLTIADSVNANTNFVPGSRMAVAMFWNVTLSAAQLGGLRQAMLPRFT